jgi:hypothetical protein
MRNHKGFDLEAELAALDAPPKPPPTESVDEIMSKIEQRERLKEHAAALEEWGGQDKSHFADMTDEQFANEMRSIGIGDFPSPPIREKQNVKK